MTLFKDPTGNRRYWPVEVRVSAIRLDQLRDERNQIWAEAVAFYNMMRFEHPIIDPHEPNDLPLYLRDPESQRISVELQDRARKQSLPEQWTDTFMRWFDLPVELSTLTSEMGEATKVQRIAFLDADVEQQLKAEGALSTATQADTLHSAKHFLEKLTQPKELDKNRHRKNRRVGGVVGRWWIRGDATPEEVKQGYRVYDEDLTED